MIPFDDDVCVVSNQEISKFVHKYKKTSTLISTSKVKNNTFGFYNPPRKSKP